jgi:hypothetical protein
LSDSSVAYRASAVDKKFDPATVRRLHEDQGQSLRAIARRYGRSYPTVRRAYLRAIGNGHLPAVSAPPPIAIPSQPVAMPSQPIAMKVDELKTRVATLEAFMAAMQAQHRITAMPSQSVASQPVAVHRSQEIPWVSRGLQVAADMAEAIETYARKHQLKKREVLDLALRSFLAQVAGEGGADA